MLGVLLLAATGCGDDSGAPPGDVSSGGNRDAGDTMDATAGDGDTGDGDTGDGDTGDGDTGDGDIGDGDTGDGDTGDGDTGDGDTDDTDAGTPGCPNDCRGLAGQCTTVRCNETTLECEITPVADGTACGSRVNDACTEPDQCVAGVCQARHRLAGVVCGDDGIECRMPDTCDGNGVCVDNGAVGAGTPCGSQTVTACSAADSCDGSGNCSPNDAAVDTPCGDEQLCVFAPLCDGSGSCLPALPKPNTARCGPVDEPIGVISECHPRDMYCDGAGGCDTAAPAVAGATPTLRDGMRCTKDGNSDLETDCNLPDVCINYRCSDNFAPSSTLCGPPGQEDSVCDPHDHCNGFGTCLAVVAGSSTECFSGDECNANAFCDGAGACDDPVPADSGTACGDETEVACNYADSCDGSGSCQDNLWGEGVGCGDTTDYGICDRPDTCTAGGVCEDNVADSGTDCTTASTACLNGDTCDGGGSCIDNGFRSICTLYGEVQAGGSAVGAGILVEAVDGNSTTTDTDGTFQLDLPVDQPFFLRVGDQSGYYGRVTARSFAPEDFDSYFTFSQAADAQVEAAAGDVGLTLTGGGVVNMGLFGFGVEGGETVSISATSSAAVGYVSPGTWGYTNMALPDVEPLFYFYNVATGSSMATINAVEDATCTPLPEALSSYPVFEHVVTEIEVLCE